MNFHLPTPNNMCLIMKNLPYFICKPYLRPTQNCICKANENDDPDFYDKDLGISLRPEIEENSDPEKYTKRINDKCKICGGGLFRWATEEEFLEFEEQCKKAKKSERDMSINTKARKRKQRLKEQGNWEDKRQRGRPKYVTCVAEKCLSPSGLKCVHTMCRKCCKSLCLEKFLDCKNHGMAISRQKNKNVVEVVAN